MEAGNAYAGAWWQAYRHASVAWRRGGRIIIYKCCQEVLLLLLQTLGRLPRACAGMAAVGKRVKAW